MPDTQINFRQPASWLLCISLAMLAGCSSADSAARTEALRKCQTLGAKINLKQGGYEIDFSQTPVEDKDLAPLADIPSIKLLYFTGTRITDEALVYLDKLPALEQVNLKRTLVTPSAVEALRQKRPMLIVHY